MMNKKYLYNWEEIQKFYDSGNSWRDIKKNFGVSNRAIEKAVKRGSLKMRTPSEAAKIRIAKYGIVPMNEASRKKLSIKQSVKNSGGKCKWFVVEGQSVQGTWEKRFAEKLSSFNIKWKKLSTNKDVWSYECDGKSKSYTPDFYLPEFDLFIEIKGFWWANDKKKMEIIKEKYSTKKLLILEKEKFEWFMKQIDKTVIINIFSHDSSGGRARA